MIYLDNSATTKVDDDVKKKIIECLDIYGNPSSLHQLGEESNEVLYFSRERIANALGCKPEEIYFTSGGSEGDNWAIKGVAFAHRHEGNHIITSCIEHHAVTHSCEWLKDFGFNVTYESVDSKGHVSPKSIEEHINDNTVLVSIMYANNEIGSIQPIKEIHEICKNHGVILHTDAVQAFGHVKDFSVYDADIVTLSAHKFGVPKGVGLMFIREGIEIDNLIHGGGQESGRRAGTENLPYIYGMSYAIQHLTDVSNKCDEEEAASTYLMDKLFEIKEVTINSPVISDRVPNIVNFRVDGVRGEQLQAVLSNYGFCVSTGSACNSDSNEPSHVLKAIGLTDEEANSSIRVSISNTTTKDQIDSFIECLKNSINLLR